MRQHILRRGETLPMLSARYGIPVCMIIKANEGADTRGMLLIPDAGFCSLCHDKSFYTDKSYTVAAGDTLLAIAARFGTTADAVIRRNGISGGAVAEGDVLRIPCPPAGTRVYTVKMAQDIDAVSSATGVPAERICSLNALPRRAALYAGMQLFI